mmetsp:Transcript_133/g.286  ORF Transcript_133/g.286 Transcript_133/m.286 type:complete len:116 (+) Transcript_133:775-1122(+)
MQHTINVENIRPKGKTASETESEVPLRPGVHMNTKMYIEDSKKLDTNPQIRILGLWKTVRAALPKVFSDAKRTHILSFAIAAYWTYCARPLVLCIFTIGVKSSSNAVASSIVLFP